MKPITPHPLTSQELKLLLEETDESSLSPEEQEREADCVVALSQQILSHPLSWIHWQRYLHAAGKSEEWQVEPEIDEDLWEVLQDSPWESWLRQIKYQWGQWWLRSSRELQRKAAMLWQVPISARAGTWIPRSLESVAGGEDFPLLGMFIPLSQQTSPVTTSDLPSWSEQGWCLQVPVGQPLIFRTMLQKPGYLALLQLPETSDDADAPLTLLFPRTPAQDQSRQAGIHDLFFYRFLEPGQAHFLLVHSSLPITSWLPLSPRATAQETYEPLTFTHNQLQHGLQTNDIQGLPLCVTLTA